MTSKALETKESQSNIYSVRANENAKLKGPIYVDDQNRECGLFSTDSLHDV